MVVASMGHEVLARSADEEGDVVVDPLRVILEDESMRGCLPGLELGVEESAKEALSVRKLEGGLVEEEGGVSDS